VIATASDRTVEKLLRQQAALAKFGSFASNGNNLRAILTEAASICAASLGVPFCKICRYRPIENDLLVEAGWGWNVGVVGLVVSKADETSPQGRAYLTGEPMIIRDLRWSGNFALPNFYWEHGIISTLDVVIPATDGAPYGVLEVGSTALHPYDVHDINFLRAFANMLAAAVATAKRDAAMLALLEQQQLLAEELQHRVRNNLFMVSEMLATYARSAPDEAARNGIGSISGRVMTLAQVYESLLGVGLSQDVDLGSYLHELCESLPALQEVRIRQVDLHCRAKSIMFPLQSVTVIGLIVTELVSNSYRHAFPDREGTITVTLGHGSEANVATLTIRDNGVGYAPNPKSLRRGLSLVARLAEQVGGTVDHRTESGVVWTLAFPLPVLSATPTLGE